ncbi:DUF5984 family protein [Actinoplanes sp. NPDC049548]|uniref:DUF5984 family protein n=1 Tax=Actinoplanes sp. NPDC049548 TaxID=3155152 RepID=UPI0034185A8C
MIDFRFRLCPLDEVSPWGGDQPSLSWFGLTEGWYWIEVGGHELLRRTRLDDPFPYVDYYLARFSEDVNLLAPDVLEPVPAELQPFIASDPDEWACNWLEFIGDGDKDPNAPDHPVVTAVLWHDAHAMDFGYLRNPPHLRLWRTVRGDRDEITLDWRHEDDGEIGFTAGPVVRVGVPTADYLEAVHTLDRKLMTAMRQRVEELERRGGRPGVEIDLPGLRREHEDRTQWLARNLARSPKTDWDVIAEGARPLLGDAHRAGPPTT